jgi:hypothetical protein
MVDGRLERIRYGLEAIDQLIQRIENLSPTGFPGASGWAYTRDQVLPWLVRVKSPAFHEEQEWRVIVEALDGGHMGVKFRTSDYIGLVPYISLSFSPKALRKVVVGPGAHPSLREVGVKSSCVPAASRVLRSPPPPSRTPTDLVPSGADWR